MLVPAAVHILLAERTTLGEPAEERVVNVTEVRP